MKENCTTLYPNAEVGQKVSEYADKHSLKLDEKLAEYFKVVVEPQPQSYYTVSMLEARYLAWMAKMMGAKRVLEIGSFVGFSLAVWADAVGEEGKVTGMEFSSKYAAISKEKLPEFGWNNIEVLEGNAFDMLPNLKPTEPYDIIFIDANKGGYPTYLRTILDKSRADMPASERLLRKGGLIIGDNALRSALVVDRTDANPATKTVPKQTENWQWSDAEKLDEFNKIMHDCERIEDVLLPVFDGLAMGRLMD